MIGGNCRRDFSPIKALRLRERFNSELNACNGFCRLIEDFDAMAGQITAGGTFRPNLEAYRLTGNDRSGNIPDGQARFMLCGLERKPDHGFLEYGARDFLR